MIQFKDKYQTTLTPNEINSWLKSLDAKRIGFPSMRAYKIRMDGFTFSIRVKHTHDIEEGPKATAHGTYYKSSDSTIVDLITKPSYSAMVIFIIVAISVPIGILIFPENISSAEDLTSNQFAQFVALGIFMLFMIPIGYLVIFMPMHEIRYFIEKELKLQEIY